MFSFRCMAENACAGCGPPLDSVGEVTLCGTARSALCSGYIRCSLFTPMGRSVMQSLVAALAEGSVDDAESVVDVPTAPEPERSTSMNDCGDLEPCAAVVAEGCQVYPFALTSHVIWLKSVCSREMFLIVDGRFAGQVDRSLAGRMRMSVLSLALTTSTRRP